MVETPPQNNGSGAQPSGARDPNKTQIGCELSSRGDKRSTLVPLPLRSGLPRALFVLAWKSAPRKS